MICIKSYRTVALPDCYEGQIRLPRTKIIAQSRREINYIISLPQNVNPYQQLDRVWARVRQASASVTLRANSPRHIPGSSRVSPWSRRIPEAMSDQG